MQIKIQQWGNSGAVRLNKDLLRLMSTEIGGVLDVEVKDNMLMLRPAAPEYSLDDLLEKKQEACFSLSDEDQTWLNPVPTGKEGL